MSVLRHRSITSVLFIAMLTAFVGITPGVGVAKAAIAYTYYPNGRLESVTNSAGQTASYQYDAAGNVTSITNPAAGPSQQNAPGRAESPPVVTTVYPTVVRYGDPITITGRGFSVNASGDVVHVGALFARVVHASSGSLLVSAPPGVGGSVEIATPGGHATGPNVTITPTAQAPDPSPTTTAASSPARELHAAPGITAVSGVVETNRGRPVPGVQIAISDGWGPSQSATVTDSQGRFLLGDLSAGQHELVIDANHVAGSSRYGLYAEPIELPEGRTTVLPWVTYLTPLDLAHAVSVASPTRSDIVVTNPDVPGVQVEIPKGTVIRDHYGRIVNQLSITPIATDRPPLPLAPGMPMFFTLQPGDATFSGPGITVVYPNVTHKAAGTAVAYVAENPTWSGSGWYRSGTGHVSADGRSIIADPGVRYHRVVPFGYMNPLGPPPTAPPGCGCDSPPGNGPPGAGAPGAPSGSSSAGDPVNLPTGLYLVNATDLTLPDVEPATLTRTYRQYTAKDTNHLIDTFGMAMSDSFDYYVYPLGPDQDAPTGYELVEPDGGKIVYNPTATTGVYSAVGTPTTFFDSHLTTTGTFPGNFSPTITLTNGTVYQFGENNAMLNSVTDRYGNSITIGRSKAFPGNEGPLTVTTTDGRWIHFSYGVCLTGTTPTDCVTSATDNIGQSVNYAYDTSTGQLTQVTAANGGITTYTWGAACTTPGSFTCTEITGVKDPLNNTITTSYDPGTGQATGQLDPNGGTWKFSYSTNGLGVVTTTVTDPNHTVNKYVYDANGYPQSETGASGTTISERMTYTFDATTNLLTKTTDPIGRTTTYQYDPQGDLLQTTQLFGTANPSVTSYTYDPNHDFQLASVTDPLSHTWSITYNPPTGVETSETVTDPMDNKSVYALNAHGQPVAITDAYGKTTYLSYLSDDLVAVTDPLGNATSIYYDAEGRPLAVTDPRGFITQNTWTPLNELATTTDSLNEKTGYLYDFAGNLLSVTDANNNQTSYHYNNMIEVDTQTDPLHNADHYLYDKLGNLTSQIDRNGILDKVTYDALDRLTQIQYGVAGATAQSTIGATYDLADRLTQVVDSASGTYGLGYDGLDNVTSAASPQGNIGYQYNNASLRTQMTVPNQTQTNYQYNNDDLLTQIQQGTSTVALGYDNDLRPNSITLPDGILRSSTYNNGSQLIALNFTHGTTKIGNVKYTYNPDSQIISTAGSLAATNIPAPIASNTYNADNELTNQGATSYHYDNNGALQSDGTNTYTRNDRDELTGISGTTNATFTYDPFGRRASDTINATNTSFLYDGLNVVQQLAGTTPSANMITGGLDQTFQVSNSAGTSSLLTDQLGSTMALADTNGTTLTTTYTYDPYGNTTTAGTANPNNIQYAGTQNDGTGLNSMGARYYDPSQERFISQDPISFDGGTTNLYDYVGNDPINVTDLSGLKKGKGCPPGYWTYGGHCHPPTPPGTCLYFPSSKLNKGCPLCVPYTPPPNHAANAGWAAAGAIPFVGTVVSGAQTAVEGSQAMHGGTDAENAAAAHDYNVRQGLYK
jgi:RHS repeat-associated protein